MWNKKELTPKAISSASKAHNTQFWPGHLVIRHFKGTHIPFVFIDVGMPQPSFTFPQCKQEDHKDGIKFMTQKGPVVSECVPLLNIKGKCAHIFTNIMKSSVVKAAIEADYRPLFLLKHALLKECSKNVTEKGYQFTTMDKTPASHLALIGFCKGKEEDGDLSVVSMTNGDNTFLHLSKDLMC